DVDSYPLVAVIGFRPRVDTVPGFKGAIHHHMRTRRAEICRCALILTVATEKLYFYGDGKILIYAHRRGILAMQHRSAVSKGPARTFISLLSDETIFKTQYVVRELIFMKDVTKLFIERRISFIADGKISVFHPKRVPIILSDGISPNLDRPVIEVLA